MKKSVLLTLTPPKLTKELREQAERDIPVIDNAWGRRKEYKYNSYIKAKIEKGYLILSVFKTEFVRSGSKYPMYIVYFDRKKGEYLSLETETGKWRTAMLGNLDVDLSCYDFKHYISEKDAEKIKKYLKIGEGDFYSICQYQSSLRTKRLDRQYKRKTDETQLRTVGNRVSAEIPGHTGQIWRLSGRNGAGWDCICDGPDYRPACQRRKEYPHLFHE